MKKILFAAAVLALGFTSAHAQYDSRYDNDHRNGNDNHNNRDYNDRSNGPDRGRNADVNMMQRQVRDDISQGIRRGTLNSREANGLLHEYDRIEMMQRKFNSHGRLSNRETRILRSELERLMAATNRLSRRGGGDWARGRNRY